MNSILSIPVLLFIPLIISLLLMSPFFTRNEIVVRRFAKGMFTLHFIYSIIMLIFFSTSNPYETNLSIAGFDWIQSIGVKCSFKLDNISIIFTTLTSFIFLLSALSSKFNIRNNCKFYYAMLFLLMTAILGIFSANDMFLFFMFWELELIPAYFLIGGSWGSAISPQIGNAQKSAVKFVLYTFFGSMFILLGILLTHYYNFISTGILSSVYEDIISSTIPTEIQVLIAICFVIGFGVKLPIIPLHAWLPDAHTDAPTPVSIVLAGILLKTGAYGIYRFNYEIFNESFKIIAPYIAILALINIIYTTFIAYAQTDIKRIIVYSSISNMGLILLGLCTMNKIGLSASIFHCVAHALVTAGLFMIAGIVYIRCKTRNINEISGIANFMPRLFGFSMVIVLASIGIPLFAPFISEILTIIGALTSELSDIIRYCGLFALPLLIVSSCYMLKFLHKSFYGEQKEGFEKINDISTHEFIVLLFILVELIIFGLYPNSLLSFITGQG